MTFDIRQLDNLSYDDVEPILDDDMCDVIHFTYKDVMVSKIEVGHLQA